MGVRMIQCKPIDYNLVQTHGDVIFLEESKARSLADRGMVSYEGYTPLAATPSRRVSRKETQNDKRENTKEISITANENYLIRSGWRKHSHNAIRPRVIWIQDRSKLGGAERSNDFTVSVGEDLGFDIIGVTPAMFNIELAKDSDVVVINNVFEFSANQFYQIQKVIYENRIPYVKYEHDYRELSRLNISRPLFSHANLVVFLSPKHRKDHEMELGRIDHAAELPLAVDLEFYVRKETDGERSQKNVIIPSPGKCGDELSKFMEDNKQYNYIFVGGDTNGIRIAKGVSHSGIPRQQPDAMRKLFATSSMMVHLPKNRWAGERIIIEAMSCGCEVVTNDNAGHRSWGDEKYLLDSAKTAPYKFWERVEKVCYAR